MTDFKYRAFISYSHEDEKWAAWLHRKLEQYRVPKRIIESEGLKANRLTPIFRDREELGSASSLTNEIDEALADSEYLIVVCSPTAAKSHWVNIEIERYIALGGAGRILCLIVDGEPPDCFPQSLQRHEPLAADARGHADGRNEAKLKIVSGLLGIGLGELRQREVQRRQRRLLGVSAASFVVVLVMGILTTFALLARQEAEREAATSEQVIEFLVDLFEVSSPGEARGNAVTAREILDRGVARISGELEDQPLTQARLIETMGSVYTKLGLYESALPLLNQALETRRRVMGDEDPETLSSISAIAGLQLERGRFNLAEEQAGEVLEVQRRVLGESHPDTLTSMRRLALAYSSQARYEEAEELLRQTLEAHRHVLGEEHSDTVRTMNSLAAMYQNRGRFDEAELLYREALEIARRTDGEDHPTTLTFIHNLASISISQGRYDDGEDFARRALAARKRILGEDHRYTFTSAFVLALAHFYAGRLDEAGSVLVETLANQRRVLGEEHPDSLETASLLAEVYQGQGRYEQAEVLHRGALEISRRTLGPEHLRTQWSMYNLASVYQDQRRYDEAEPLFRETLEIELRLLGEDHPETVDTAYRLAGLEALRGDREKALDWLRQAIEYGFSDIESMIEDANLESLRGDPEFEGIVAELREQAGRQ